MHSILKECEVCNKNINKCIDCFDEKLEEHDKQIRAEAIEEFKEEIKSLIYKWFEKGVINTSQIDKIAEQLKEQNK